MKTQHEVISNINHIIEVLNERVLGYKKGADNVEDPTLKSIFNKYALQAENFIRDLEKFSDKTAEELGTRPQGDAWRIWMDIKSALTSGGRDAMLGACITGEEAAIRNYEDVIEDEDLPVDIGNKLKRQLEEINMAYNHIKSLK